MLTHEDFLALRFPADAHEVAPVRRLLDRWLRDAGVGQDEASDLVLATSEAVNNAVEHAYAGNGDGTVELSAEVCDDEICVAVTDHGRWRIPPKVLTTRGRGLLLMRESVDEVVIDRSPRGTTVTLRRDCTPLTLPPTVRPPAHEVHVHETSSGVVAVVLGDVPDYAGPSLRRTLTTAARGGTVPLTVDLAGLGADTDGAVHALFAVAQAAMAAGNRVTVVAPPGSSARKAVETTGLRHVADVQS